MGRRFPFCPVTAVEAIEDIAIEEIEEIDVTPQVVGSATTGSGITADIVYYPGEAVFKYGVIFPEPYHIWSKPREFRTYEDAQWYVTDVVSPAPAEIEVPVTPEEPVIPEVPEEIVVPEVPEEETPFVPPGARRRTPITRIGLRIY